MRHHIANLFAAAGLSRFSLAHEIDTLIMRAQRTAWKRLGIAILISFILGFGLCYAWFGVQVTVLQHTVSAWKTQYDAEHAQHHAKEVRPVSKAAAQVIVQRKEDARVGGAGMIVKSCNSCQGG